MIRIAKSAGVDRELRIGRGKFDEVRNLVKKLRSGYALPAFPAPAVPPASHSRGSWSPKHLKPRETRDRHRTAVQKAQEQLKGRGALSRQGLGQAVDNLWNGDGLISEDDKSILERLIDTLFCSEALETVRDAVVGLFESLDDRVGEVTKAIVAIACDSVDYAAELRNEGKLTAFVTPVCHDVRGALDGATVGAALAGRLSPQRIPAAVLGAIAGGAATSIIGFLHEPDGTDGSSRDCPG